MSLDKYTLRSFFFGIIFLICIGYIGYVPQQSDFAHIIIPYTICFATYVYFLRYGQEKTNLKWLIGLCLLSRFILVFAFPNLSDDIYRFLWDGYLILDGTNPFQHLPSAVIENNNINGITSNLYDLLNSQNYFTIYPTIAQAVFVASAAISTTDWNMCSIIMKIILLGSEALNLLLIIKILSTLNLNRKNVLIYGLNPLVIIEIMGNVHYEGLMLTGILGCYFCLLHHKVTLGAISLAFGIGVKLIPLLYMPTFLFSKIHKRFWIPLIVVTGLLFLPMILSFPFFASSLDLYFRSFEYNASVYYFLRWIGYNVIGFNLIHILGPSLALLTAMSVTLYIYKKRKSIHIKNLPLYFLISHSIFLFLATTVHPWYLILPVAWSVFTKVRFALVWSFLICFTYINYSYDPYFENTIIVCWEYITLVSFILIYDYKKRPNLQM